jgi:hypothetical protein
MSASGLGCVKTQRRCSDVEWTFHQMSLLVAENFADLFGRESFRKIILVAFRFFEFSHSQGQKRTSAFVTAKSALPS